MSVLTLQFELPAEIALGLADGSLIRHANRIYDVGAHKIVYHLAEVGAKEAVKRGPKQLAVVAVECAKDLGEIAAKNADKAMNFVKANPAKAGVVGLAVAGVAVGAGAAANYSKKRKEDKEQALKDERARITNNLDSAFQSWSAAAKRGEVDLQMVKDLQAAWSAYEASNKAVGIDLSDDPFARAIHQVVLQYAEALNEDAQSRGAQLAIEAPKQDDSTDALIMLQRQLLEQEA